MSQTLETKPPLSYTLMRFLPLVVAFLALLLYGKAAVDNSLIYDAGERALLFNTTQEPPPAPLTGAVLTLEERAFGSDPAGDGYQWFGALLAALAGLAAYAAYRGGFGINPVMAAGAAALLMMHPGVSSAVFASATGRGALLALLFTAAAVAAWSRPGPVWGVAAAILGAWAALSHPQALLVIPLLAIVPVPGMGTAAAAGAPDRLPRRLALLLAFGAVVAVWWLTAGVPSIGGDALAPLRSLAYLLTTAFVPTWSAVPEPSFAGWWGAAGALRLGIAVVLLALLLVGFRQAGGRGNNSLGRALLWFAALLLPVLQVFHQEPAYAERYLALPLFGLVALVALVVSRWPGRMGSVLRLRWVLPIPLGVLIALSAERADTFRDAGTYHRQWVATSPDSVQAHLGLAVALMRARAEGEDPSVEALAAVRRAAELAPENADVQRHLGDLLDVRGQRVEAIAAYRRGLELAPEDGGLALRLGDLLLSQQPAEAEAAYRRAAEALPQQLTPRLRLAKALARQGKGDEAVSIFEQILAEQPDDPSRQAQLRVDYGNVLADLGRNEEALAAYRHAVELDPQLAAAHYNLGLTLLGLGRGDEAVSSFREAIAQRPDYPEAHTNLGVVLAGRGELEEALDHYRRAVELRPNDGGAHFNLGQGLILAGQIEEGVDELRRGVEVEPESASGHLLLGQTYMSLGQLGPAVESFQNALRLRPQWVEPMIPLAWILATSADDDLRDGETALRLAQNATHQTQYRNIDALNALAAAYAETGEFDKAIQVSEEVAKRLKAAKQEEAADSMRLILEMYRAEKPLRTGGRPDAT